jgi:hypothetical protein
VREERNIMLGQLHITREMTGEHITSPKQARQTTYKDGPARKETDKKAIGCADVYHISHVALLSGVLSHVLVSQVLNEEQIVPHVVIVLQMLLKT